MTQVEAAPPGPDATESAQLAGATVHAQQLGKQRDRALLAGAGTTLAVKIVSAFGGLITFAIAAHNLPRAELGIVALLTTLVVLLGFGDFGLGALIMTRLPAARARGDADEMRSIVSSALTALGTIAMVVIVAGSVASFAAPWRSALGAQQVPDGDLRWSLLCFFIFGGLWIPATLGARILLSLQRAATARLWDATSTVITIGLTVGCAAADAPMWAYVAAIAGTPTVLGLVQLQWLLGVARPELRPRRFLAPRAQVLAFLRSGSLYGVLSLGWLISYSIDSLVVSSIKHAAATAVFAVAARMFNLVIGTLSSASQQLWPALADAFARQDLEWIRSRFRHTMLITVGLAASAAIVLIVAGRPLARLWVGGSLVPPLSLLITFGLWTVLFLVMNQATYVLSAAGRIGVLAFTGLVMAPVNLLLSIVFTKAYGLAGPILGSIVALLLVQTVPVIVLTRQELNRPSVPGRHRRRRAGAAA